MEVQTLRLAVGVALVPVGALVTLTADNREREGSNKDMEILYNKTHV